MFWKFDTWLFFHLLTYNFCEKDKNKSLLMISFQNSFANHEKTFDYKPLNHKLQQGITIREKYYWYIVANKQSYQHMIGYKLLKFLVSQANLCSKINIKWMQDILNSQSVVLYYCSPSWKFHNLFCKFLELEILWKHASMVELIIDSSFFNPSRFSCKAQWLLLKVT